jgi:SAM-dependent methyltransferase
VDLHEIYEVEQKKWDERAQNRFSQLKPLKKDFHGHARNTYTLKGFSEFLGTLDDKLVLEIGCGLGKTATNLAMSGAVVVAMDISFFSVVATDRQASLNNVSDRVHLLTGVGEKLPFASESFDVVFGKGVLHHLDVGQGWSEIERVLKPGGKAAFSEPMGMNPILDFVRDYVPYPGKNPRGADVPLNYKQIKKWGSAFDHFEYQEIQLLSMIERGFGHGTKFPILRRTDERLLKAIPFLRRFCRYVLMYMEKS